MITNGLTGYHILIFTEMLVTVRGNLETIVTIVANYTALNVRYIFICIRICQLHFHWHLMSASSSFVFAVANYIALKLATSLFVFAVAIYIALTLNVSYVFICIRSCKLHCTDISYVFIGARICQIVVFYLHHRLRY